MGKRGGVFAEARPGIEQRNAEMLRRYKAGENFASIGASLGFTRERVRQIVKQSGARMPWEYTCAVKDCETSPRAPRRVQLTTDGHKAYLEAVEGTFGGDVDYARLVKLYGKDPRDDHKYSPATCIGSTIHPV